MSETVNLKIQVVDKASKVAFRLSIYTDALKWLYRLNLATENAMSDNDMNQARLSLLTSQEIRTWLNSNEIV